MLRDKFQDVGEVKFAEMRGTDMGMVRFASEWDAERAVCILLKRVHIAGNIGGTLLLVGSILMRVKWIPPIEELPILVAYFAIKMIFTSYCVDVR